MKNAALIAGLSHANSKLARLDSLPHEMVCRPFVISFYLSKAITALSHDCHWVWRLKRLGFPFLPTCLFPYTVRCNASFGGTHSARRTPLRHSANAHPTVQASEFGCPRERRRKKPRRCRRRCRPW